MLHLIFQSPIEAAILARIASSDDVVFLENAVLRVAKQGDLNAVLTELQVTSQLFVLADALVIRGISIDDVVSGITVIDYAELVALTVKNRLIQSWY
jgi:sulfur relay protein TusB/DsrH